MSELRGPRRKNVVVTGGAERQCDSHVLAFPEAGYDFVVLDVTRPVEGVHALATVEMTDPMVKVVEGRGVRCHQVPRIAA